MKSVVSQKFWDQSYNQLYFSELSDDNTITNLISRYIKNLKSKEVFEIGCFPGGYLNYFAKKGAIVSGVDLTPRTLEMVEWLKKRNNKVGSIIKQDILNFKTQDKYDLVCSFGFIEHFKEWESILDIHDRLLEKNGLLVITCPNFYSPIIWLYHRIFDRDNLSKHVFKSMNYQSWIRYLESRNYQIIYQGSFGKPQFWFDTYIADGYLSALRERFTIWLNQNSCRLPILKNVKPINGIIAKKI